MEPITTLLGAGVVILGRKFAINSGKKFAINLLDKYGLLSAKAYLDKAMSCECLDDSITYTLKALKKNPDYKEAYNWREILLLNVKNKVSVLNSEKNKQKENISLKNSELEKIKKKSYELITEKEKANKLRNILLFLFIVPLFFFAVNFSFPDFKFLFISGGVLSLALITYFVVNTFNKIKCMQEEISQCYHDMKMVENKIRAIQESIKAIDEGIELMIERRNILTEGV